MAGQKTLGRDHPGAAGADDLVRPGDRLGPEGHGRDSLGPADLVDHLDPREPGGHQGRRIDLSVRSGRRHDGQLRHPGHHAGHRGHHRDRRKGALAPRHIERHGFHRQEAVAGKGPGADLLQPHGLGGLLLVEAADIADAEADRVDHRIVHGVEGGVELGLGGLQRGLGQGLGLVEAAPEADQRGVALGAHGLDDRRGALEEGRQVRLRPLRQRRPRLRLHGFQPPHGHVSHRVSLVLASPLVGARKARLRVSGQVSTPSRGARPAVRGRAYHPRSSCIDLSPARPSGTGQRHMPAYIFARKPPSITRHSPLT
ncbi:hypothetical protein ROA7023_00169 [Roseisalinus antarcticus]|uniref:Uncharacterized protein n=1 Tax=Roseisalinus antarcticus TaxID=254357 RepID=A0A1Y5RDT8_9RHOB|nr:hypothetical protein ROA7023_00169 [Roseisalinus antarcticus]